MKTATILWGVIVSVLSVSYVLCMDQPDQHALTFDKVVAQEEQVWQCFLTKTKTTPLTTLIERNEIALLRLEHEVHAKEKNALAGIKQQFFVDKDGSRDKHEIWKKCRAGIAGIKNANKGYMMCVSCSVHQDYIDSDIMYYVNKQFIKNGINPESVVLRHCYGDESGDFIYVQSPTVTVANSQDGIRFKRSAMQPGQFIISASVLDRSLEEQKALCDTMLYRFIKQHSLTQYIVQEFLMLSAGLTRDELIKNATWQQLLDAQNEQAALMPCLKNEKRIGGMQQFLQKCQPSSLKNGLFHAVCRLNTLLKQRTLLRKIVPISLHIKSFEIKLLNKVFEVVEKGESLTEYISCSQGIELKQLLKNGMLLELLKRAYGEACVASAIAQAEIYS